jgi:glutamate-1-semialdehyde aminotransferase
MSKEKNYLKLKKGIGQKLWSRAKKIIPGGSMLFSKNPDLFLPDFWPSYFTKTKGYNIWGVDKKKYIDLCSMGIGTNILGYSNREVDSAVLEVVKNGNMSTLNSSEEIFLAEKLVDMHPWADMARFMRTGGEANAVAIRLARAATNRDKIAVCGYHGWHDWYLSANLSNPRNLDSHLLKNLKIKGVNKSLKDTALVFDYNNFNQLEKIVNKHNIAAVIMEVSRNYKPENNFLEKVRSLTKRKNIVLIFDECTSGFRQSFGGLHLFYKINPDLATFGKALGNGYSICAVLGRKEIMEATKNTFISSTFWTDRIGSVAALKTLEIMEKTKSWETISKTGLLFKKKLLDLANSYNFNINIEGLDALPRYNFLDKNNLYYKTYITQEFLKKNILANNSIYISVVHGKGIINKYFYYLDRIFSEIFSAKKNKKIKTLLQGRVCISGLRSKKINY